MATSVSAGAPLYLAGMSFTALLGRQFGSGTAVIDSGTSASALTPAAGTYPGGLAVTAPASGMSVNVSAGYCCVPSSTAQGGAYRFGLMASGSLTVASNATGSTRQDYVIASVSDNGDNTSSAQVAYVTGTTSVPAVPASAIVLAQVSVPNAASSIVAGDITDLRGFVCAPGGILYIPAETDAPAAPLSQLMWEADISRLVQGSGIQGSVLAAVLTGGAAVASVPVVTTYSAAGSYTYTAPPGVTTGFIEVIAAGGSGANESGFNGGGGGGGGGGEYAAEPAYPLSPGTAYPVSVGTGGTGTSANGNPGGNSTFATTGIVAHGGKGGKLAGESGGGTPGAGGSGSTATVSYPGGSGGAGGPETDSGSGGGGGGGGSAGQGSAGNPGAAGTATAAGAGATPVAGGGPGGTGGGTAPPGKASAPSTGPGGGSGGTGGGANATSVSQPPGADGLVRITTTASAATTALDYVPHLVTTTDGTTVAQVSISADGATDYEICYGRDTTTGGTHRQAFLRLYLDNSLIDTTYAQDTTSIQGRMNVTAWTSRALGTTPAKGLHVIKLTGSAATAAYTLRIAPVIT